MESTDARIRKYCSYQERSQQEVRDKLYSEGLHRNEVEQTISQLISEGFINEERFAMAYASGKFRIKHWGRVKIRLALKNKMISEYCINKALKQISEPDYIKTLASVVSSYSRKLSEKDIRKRKYKIAQHAIGKGYEAEMVWDYLNREE